MEIFYSHPTQEKIVGNIYKGRVEDVLPGLGSAFVDVGEKKSLFLSKGEINDAIMISHGFKPWHGAPPINKLLRPGQTLILQVRRGGSGRRTRKGRRRSVSPGGSGSSFPPKTAWGSPAASRVYGSSDACAVPRVS